MKGMVYFYSMDIKMYGNFKFFNCLVDSCWMVKIVDYGFLIIWLKWSRSFLYSELYY